VTPVFVARTYTLQVLLSSVTIARSSTELIVSIVSIFSVLLVSRVAQYGPVPPLVGIVVAAGPGFMSSVEEPVLSPKISKRRTPQSGAYRLSSNFSMSS